MSFVEWPEDSLGWLLLGSIPDAWTTWERVELRPADIDGIMRIG
jgi:hypothetical protein